MSNFTRPILSIIVAFFTVSTLFGQCPGVEKANALDVVANFDAGANSHQFVMNFLRSEQPPNVLTKTDEKRMMKRLELLTQGGAIDFPIDSVEIVYDHAQADGVIYEVNYPGHGWTVEHSSVQIDEGVYLSKWKSCGPVILHALKENPYLTHPPKDYETRVRFWRYNGSIKPHRPLELEVICDAPTCATPKGAYRIHAPPGWKDHKWAVSKAGRIVEDNGDHVLVKRRRGYMSDRNTKIVVSLMATNVDNEITEKVDSEPLGFFPLRWNKHSIAMTYKVNRSKNELTVSFSDVNGNALPEEFLENKAIRLVLMDENGQLLGLSKGQGAKLKVRSRRPVDEGIYILRAIRGKASFSRRWRYKG